MPKACFEPFRVLENGDRILQCHSKGYKDIINGRETPIFSPYGVNLSYGKMNTSLENLFMRSRIFDHDGVKVRPADWKQAREWMKVEPQIGWHFGKEFLPCLTTPQKTDGWTMDEPGIKFYIALWADFLKTGEGERRLGIARQFDGFEDPFAAAFPFCQARIIECAVKQGVEHLDLLAGDIRNHMLEARFAQPQHVEQQRR